MSGVIISDTQDDKLDELIEYMGSSVPAKLNELNAKIDGISSYYQEATLTGKEVQAQLVNTIKPESGKVTIGGVEYDNFKALHEKLDEKVSQVSDILDAKIDSVVNVTSDQVVNGVKTFSSPPVLATNPTQGNEVANKSYVDDALGSKLSVSTYDIDKQSFATKNELTNGLNAKADGATTYTKTEVDNLVNVKANRDELNTKLNITTYNADKANFATKAELAGAGAYLVEKWSEGNSGYRLYSDGYCEQWGIATANFTEYFNQREGTAYATITYYKPYISAVSYLLIQPTTGSYDETVSTYIAILDRYKSTIGVHIRVQDSSLSGISIFQKNLYWKTSGYIR